MMNKETVETNETGKDLSVSNKNETCEPKIVTVIDGKPLTKSGLKKYNRRLKVKEMYRAKKEAKKIAKQKERLAKGISDVGSTKSQLSDDKREELRLKKAAAKEAWLQKISLGQRVIIDCDFHDLMTDKEIRSLCQQLGHCYNLVRTDLESPFNLHIGSVHGRIKSQLEKIGGFDSWALTSSEDAYDKTYTNKDELVYLTADSDNTIETLDANKIYIIGGLVDRNRYKSITLNRSKDKNISTARLPIGEYLKLHSSNVLTVNHVMQILVNFNKTKDWKVAFESVIPARKATGESSKKRWMEKHNSNKRKRDDESDVTGDVKVDTKSSSTPEVTTPAISTDAIDMTKNLTV